LCEAPIPSFCAEGGNSSETYNAVPGLGVWGFSGTGLPEDRIGTSYAAPILAREAALALSALQRYCIGGAQPFGVAVRAFLALTARKTTSDPSVADVAERTLGLGQASSRRIGSPNSGSAVILWQGIIETAKDVVRVQLPIPADWLATANEPRLRFFVCYDPPVNESARGLWACRKVNAVLHPGPESAGIRGPNRGHESYPLFSREYRLKRFAPGAESAAEGDLWVVEFTYEDVFQYPPGMDFDPRQRVAIAAELYDNDSDPVDPQPALQALPAAALMNRLSIQPTAIRNPIIVRSRTNRT
jgi:hypothetical protein